MTDLRDDLNAAFAEHDEAPEIEVPETHASPTPETTPTESPEVEAKDDSSKDSTRVRDETGKFTKTQKTSKPAVKTVSAKAATTGGSVSPAPASGALVPQTPAATEAAVQAAVAEVLKAPQTWKATVREKWAALPPEVQQEISRREKEASQAVESGAPARKFHEQFNQVMAPYQSFAQSIGTTPVGLAQQASQIAMQLSVGPPHVKAQTLAALIKSNGVDINLLAQALDGHAPQPGQGQQGQNFDPQAFRQQIKQELFQEFGQQRQAQLRQQTSAEVAQFSQKAEFLNDVREEMADYLALKAQRGVEVSMQDAYDYACKLHPEVSKTLEQRKAAEAAKAKQASTLKAKAAASSVRSQPASNTAGSQSGSLKEMIEAAWEDAEGR